MRKNLAPAADHEGVAAGDDRVLLALLSTELRKGVFAFRYEKAFLKSGIEISPLDRLAYLGRRTMEALRYEPDRVPERGSVECAGRAASAVCQREDP